MKKLILLYGLPGSGKSTLAKQLQEKYQKEDPYIHVPHIETDDWFIRHGNGTYKFDATLLNHAHRETFQLVTNWMADSEESPANVIILSNTNLTWRDIRGYVELATHNNYEVEIIETETEWRYNLDELEKRGTHNVPREVLERMNSKRQSPAYLREKVKQVQNREYQW